MFEFSLEKVHVKVDGEAVGELAATVQAIFAKEPPPKSLYHFYDTATDKSLPAKEPFVPKKAKK